MRPPRWVDRIIYGLGAAAVLALLAVPPWSVEIGKQRVSIWVAHPWLTGAEESVRFQQSLSAAIDTPLLAVELIAAVAATVLLARAFRP